MKKIGILSDTHGYWDDRYATHFAGCDEIWHAGDIGTDEVLERLNAIAPVRAVAGNIDGQPMRRGSLTVRGEIFFENNWLTIW